MKDITVESIRRIFDYNPDTGNLIRKNKDNYSHGYKPSCMGKIAGNYNDQGYIRVYVLGNSYRAHRLIWAWVYGYWPENDIDHINGCRSDNRLSNLREATCSENMRNAKKYKSNSSGTTGVVYDKKTDKYVAQIMVNYKKIILGNFYSIELAIKARRKAEEEYFGKFSRHYKSESISLEVI